MSSNNCGLEEIDVTLPMTSTQIDTLTKKLKKPLNGFFLFRTAYSQILSGRNIRLNISEVSRKASVKWKAKPDFVKQEFKNLAKQINETISARIPLHTKTQKPKKYKWRPPIMQNSKKYNESKITSDNLIQVQSLPDPPAIDNNQALPFSDNQQQPPINFHQSPFPPIFESVSNSFEQNVSSNFSFETGLML
ncbi:8818_t:CDS:1 [Ambispora leptoticha]|uniref:8818_t:CDS:1 n=1 Tax=Ambispora leptoticha TaxID=144679 RepID=A0A9N9D4Y6_9GLOM|nr:8818_t:CDS:1 [Ambispora leptoticha]